MITVTRLSITPVKGTRLQSVDVIELGADGARGDRRFYVIDERDRMLNSKLLAGFQAVVASCAGGGLTLTFPGGRKVEGTVSIGQAVETTFFSAPRRARLVDGPWSEAMSEHFRQPLRLVEGGSAVDRGADGAASLVSRASLQRLAAVAGEPELDARRFRMLIEIDGVDAHAEDRWVGASVQIGDAVVRFGGHVGRCLITSQDPETGHVDLPTLDILGSYRRDLDSTEPLPFGVYGSVLEPGAVRVGDAVLPLRP
jgi:uncharacterized protein YcbX